MAHSLAFASTTEVSTYKWGLPQTYSVQCAQTARRGQEAEQRWCSWWSEWHLLAAPCCEWTGQASGFPESSPDLLLHCWSRTAVLPSLTPDQSSSLSWYQKRVSISSAELTSQSLWTKLDNCFTDCSLKRIIKHMDPNTPYPNVLTETEQVKSKFSFVAIQFCDLLDLITEYISYLNSYFSQQKPPI